MAYDATKPVTGGSLVAADIRENFRALKEDEIVALGDAFVSQAKLKTTLGSVNVVIASGLTDYTPVLPGGEYGFMPLVKCSEATGSSFVNFSYYYTFMTTSYSTLKGKITNTSKGTTTTYLEQRYVTASGEVFWIFILRDSLTKDIYKMWRSDDHPCFGYGGKPLLMPHPFPGYDPLTEEIVVINPSKEEVLEIKEKCIRGEDEPDKDFLEVFEEEYEIDESSNPSWPTKEVTVGLPPDKDWRKIEGEKYVKPIKKIIPKPAYIIVKKLKKK